MTTTSLLQSGHITLIHYTPSIPASTWSNINDIVGSSYNFLIMFDHHYSIPQLLQFTEYMEQSACISTV